MNFAPILLGRHPKLFPNPLEFRPERFLENNTSEKFIFSYIPFSAGSRNCKNILLVQFQRRSQYKKCFFPSISGIGQKFAMLELKTLLAKALKRFVISLAEDSMEEPTLIGELITKPEDKINFHLKPRLC